MVEELPRRTGAAETALERNPGLAFQASILTRGTIEAVWKARHTGGYAQDESREALRALEGTGGENRTAWRAGLALVIKKVETRLACSHVITCRRYRVDMARFAIREWAFVANVVFQRKATYTRQALQRIRWKVESAVQTVKRAWCTSCFSRLRGPSVHTSCADEISSARSTACPAVDGTSVVGEDIARITEVAGEVVGVA